MLIPSFAYVAFDFSFTTIIIHHKHYYLFTKILSFINNVSNFQAFLLNLDLYCNIMGNIIV